MASVTYFERHSEGFLARVGHYLAGLGQRLIEAREKEAARYVNSYLALADDKTLAELGITREEIERAPKAPYFI